MKKEQGQEKRSNTAKTRVLEISHLSSSNSSFDGSQSLSLFDSAITRSKNKNKGYNKGLKLQNAQAN